MGLIVKNTTLPGLLDLLAPHSCRGCGHIGSALCDCCKKYIINQHQDFCPNCKATNKNGLCSRCQDLPPIFIASERTGLIDDLIQNYKYFSSRSLATPLAEILNSQLPVINTPVIVVPLPTINRHLRERGFDHTALLAKRLAKLNHWQTKNLLLRTNSTVQVGSTKTARQLQAAKAYTINSKIKIDPSATYLLIDDVWTTGSSMRSAIQKLSDAGISNIIVGVLAVSRLE